MPWCHTPFHHLPLIPLIGLPLSSHLQSVLAPPSVSCPLYVPRNTPADHQYPQPLLGHTTCQMDGQNSERRRPMFQVRNFLSVTGSFLKRIIAASTIAAVVSIS